MTTPCVSTLPDHTIVSVNAASQETASLARYSDSVFNPLTHTVAVWVLGTAIKHCVPDRVKPSIRHL